MNNLISEYKYPICGSANWRRSILIGMAACFFIFQKVFGKGFLHIVDCSGSV
mgnify:CR=1 FL=1